jgi:hypothetical protein
MTPGLRRYLAALTIDPMKSWTAILHNQIRLERCGVISCVRLCAKGNSVGSPLYNALWNGDETGYELNFSGFEL